MLPNGVELRAHPHLVSILGHVELVDVVLLGDHGFFGLKIEVFDQIVQESVLVVLGTDLRANTLHVQLKGRNIVSGTLSSQLFEELLIKVILSNLVNWLRELRHVIHAQLLLPVLLQLLLVFFRLDILLLDDLGCFGDFVKSVVVPLIVHEHGGLLQNTELLLELIDILVLLSSFF